jgi:hypothetical protein
VYVFRGYEAPLPMTSSSQQPLDPSATTPKPAFLGSSTLACCIAARPLRKAPLHSTHTAALVHSNHCTAAPQQVVRTAPATCGATQSTAGTSTSPQCLVSCSLQHCIYHSSINHAQVCRSVQWTQALAVKKTANSMDYWESRCSCTPCTHQTPSTDVWCLAP